ncbi:MAG: 4-(cytidine 5'-diphospho)-2-C-methyl-D-erythritol kinase, partial [Phycisphaerae bacterium]|nr:4-(cytidine 5'-diphospho)-2-C-methyl-D-erythritol kinase [Phycisphaerae bacterium]
GTLLVAAPAKINLNLLVGPRRQDGYHPIDSFVAKVTLYDHLRLSPRDDGQIVLHCTGVDCGPPAENLALRAARLLAEARAVPGASMELAKHIPPGRGLGGGSSDAAAALVGLNELWGLGLPVERLAEAAGQLGSDAPLFLGSAASRMTGRGEALAAVAVYPFWVVLFVPDFPCPTAEVYGAYDRLPYLPQQQPDPSVLADRPTRWRGRMCNQLLEAACQVSEPLRAAYERLCGAMPVPVSMTGSGSALFALCDNLLEVQKVCAAMPGDMRGGCRIVVGNDW